MCMNVGTVNYNSNLCNTRSGNCQNPQFSSASAPSNNKPDSFTNTQKIVIGTSVAAGLLVLFLARKNIAKFFKGEKEIPKEPPNTPKVDGNTNVEPPKAENLPRTQNVVSPEPPKFDGQKVLAEYKKILAEQKPFSENMTEEEKAIWRTQDKKRMEVRKQLKENNISLVEKAEFSPDPNVDVEAKKAYFASNKVDEATFNEASRLDYLEMFEKYGSRYWTNEKCGLHSFINLSSLMLKNSTDTKLSRYIDIMDRLAKRDNTGMRDASCVTQVLKDTVENMSKETFLKFIKVLKNISYQQLDVDAVKIYLEKTNFKNDKEILAAIEDLKTALKDFPSVDRTKND